MGELENKNLLRSWKEIAGYLGCDVRTCYRWEDDRGLPVHRAANGEKKSPVFAYRDELDAWFKEAFQTSNPPREAPRKGRRDRVYLGGAVLLLAAAVFTAVFLLPRRQPVDFRIEGSVFIALDKHKREMWRKDTHAEDLRLDSYYRSNFQVPHKDQPNILPVLVIRDINGDGDNEVVFALSRVRDQTGEGILFCWDRLGNQLWKFSAGRELVCPKKVFSPDYRIPGFYCHDADGDGKQEIVVEAFQAPDWPCQLTLLNSAGKTIGEFWNAGYLRDVNFCDINGDGREELIVAGVNNEYRGGCLIVFDIRNVSGGSPQSGDFACSGIGPGSMLYYVRTPYIDVSRANGDLVEGIRTIDITANKWIRGMAENGCLYEFDFRLKCVQLSFGNGFKMRRSDHIRAGAIEDIPEDAYRALLLKGIFYWDGQEWTPEPTPVRR